MFWVRRIFAAFSIIQLLLVQHNCVDCKTRQEVLEGVANAVAAYPGKGSVPPTLDALKQFRVEMSFVIQTFQGINDLDEELTLSGYLWMTWVDDFLTIPRLNEGTNFSERVDVITLDPASIWTPTIGMPGDPRGVFAVFERAVGKIAVNISTGAVKWFPGGTFTTRCPLNVRLFPFDHQSCNFVFMAWNDNNKTLFLFTKPHWVEYGDFDGNITNDRSQLWRIEESSMWMDLETSYATVTCNIKVARIPDYYLYTIIYPDLVLVIILLAGLYHPHGPERPAYFLVLLLTLSVLVNQVHEVNPPSSKLSIFVGWLTLQISMGVIFTIQSVIVASILQQEDRQSIRRELVKIDATLSKATDSKLNLGIETDPNKHSDHKLKQAALRRRILVSDSVLFLLGVSASTLTPILMYYFAA